MIHSIIIPTYNHCTDYLKPCIESIFRYTNMDDVEIVVVANGCTDNTKDYLNDLKNQFDSIGFGHHLKLVFSDAPLGYPQAVNYGIQVSEGQYITLLNNDTILLEQQKNSWLDQLNQPFLTDPSCGISGPSVQYCTETDSHFVIFFCAMIDRNVFSALGLLNTGFGTGGGEDIEFCLLAQKAGYSIHQCAVNQSEDGAIVGNFPIYHIGEGTVLDETLVDNYVSSFSTNMKLLHRKYRPDDYRFSLMNNYERHISLRGEEVPPRESARYIYAATKAQGCKTILEIGCSNGYGSQFFPPEVVYTGLDYDEGIIEAAQVEQWGPNRQFVHADINHFPLEHYDCIIAYEVIEHLENGKEIAKMLRDHCDLLIISVPYDEPVGFWGEHHVLHGLTEKDFPGASEYRFVGEHGQIMNTPADPKMNLMLCEFKQ